MDIEKYLRQNKENLENADFFELPAGLWDKIEQNLEEQDARNTPPMLAPKTSQGVFLSYQMLAKVAAGLFVVFLSYWSYQKISQSKAETAAVLQKINPELAEAELYYTSMIAEKRKELEQLNPEDLAEFEKEFKIQDSAYNMLKKELLANPIQQKVSDAMIQNLRLRIDVLNKQIELLEKFSKPTTPKNQEDEKINL